MNYHLILIGILGAALAGCGSTTGGNGGPGPGSNPNANRGTPPTTNSNHSNTTSTTQPVSRPVAYLGGKPIRPEQLHTALMEASGGRILEEYILDNQIRLKLAEAGKIVTNNLIQQERSILLATLSPDANQAARLLEELRKRRGLGTTRYDRLLRRNAGLRLLVQGDVSIPEQRIQQAYQLKYGPRYEVRLIVVDSVSQAAALIRQARAGTKSFADLAIEHSTDRSRAGGGLLPPISPVDLTWPDGVREAVAKLEVGDVSNPIALDQGFAILKLEKKIAAQPVKLDDVKAQLQQVVRRTIESGLMQKHARRLLSEADVLVVNPALKDSWDHIKQLGTDK